MLLNLPKLTDTPSAKTVVDTPDDELDVELDAKASDFFMVRPFARTGQQASLPNRAIRNLSFSEQGIYDAIYLLLEGTGIALSIEGSARGSERYGSISLFNLSGSLPDVLDRVAEHAGLFYELRDKTVFLTPEAQFVIDLPPVLGDDSLATITNSLQFLGARDVYLDRLNRTLVFKTNRRALRGISDYMANLRERRSLLVYEVHVYQVDLNDSKSQGISWNGFQSASGGIVRSSSATTGTSGTGTSGASGSTSTGSTGATSAAGAILNGTSAILSKASGSFAMGAVISGSKFNLDALLNFLQTQGSVKTLSRPRIALVSGGRGQLRVGQATTFVSKVGSNLTSALSQVTVETQTLNTGFDLSLQGDVHDGTIYTRIALNISDILRFNQFTALGTQLNLPQTSNRDVKTTVRARPGDVILLGGILVARDSADQSRGLAGWLKGSEVQRSELVLALKPRVVRFGPRGQDSLESTALPAHEGAMTRDGAPNLRQNNNRSGSKGVVPLRSDVPADSNKPMASPFDDFSLRIDDGPDRETVEREMREFAASGNQSMPTQPAVAPASNPAPTSAPTSAPAPASLPAPTVTPVLTPSTPSTPPANGRPVGQDAAAMEVKGSDGNPGPQAAPLAQHQEIR